MIRKANILMQSLCLIGIIIPLISLATVWNNPHLDSQPKNIRYSAFIDTPKTLDPARSYSSNENSIIAQIYEPPLQYHYLKRPYTLVPLTAVSMPAVTYYDTKGQVLPSITDPKNIAYTTYDITIKPGIYYQPHPAFAKNNQGEFLYHNLTAKELKSIKQLADFKQMGTRELTADDYVYEIKRLTSPKLNSPIFGVMSNYIVGFAELGKKLQEIVKGNNVVGFLDLRSYAIEGVKVIDRYHYQIKIKGVYPQFEYWLTMPFFAPIPWEADIFYSQPGMANKDITFDWYPVGTGPYQLIENNPNRQMVLLRNPNFHEELYPQEGMPEDIQKGFLVDAGKKLPFIDKLIMYLDKESIPRWNKFLQGYYDASGISTESFDQAIQMNAQGHPNLTPEMKAKGIRLETSVRPGVFYMGFNMLDSTVGGYNEKQQKLRQAIAIAIDEEEYIAIFLNGRGVAAQGPIPPGIFGYLNGRAGINSWMYDWVRGVPQRKPLAYARQLLVEAGYPNGIDPKTGNPLILNYDVATSGNPADKATYDWLREQFAKLGIELNIRATLYNRFQDEVRKGRVQIFSWGWVADYPDPENFLFLLYGPNSKIKRSGENATNYENPQFDKLFEEIRVLPNSVIRQQKINEILEIVRKDSPWVWGYYPIDFILVHQWSRVSKPSAMANNSLKYEKIDPVMRSKLRDEWNQPVAWLLVVLAILMGILMLSLFIIYRRRENQPTIRKY